MCEKSMSVSPSPTNSTPEYTFLFYNPDPPPPYEAPPPYSSVCPEAVQVIICEERHLQQHERCCNLERFIFRCSENCYNCRVRCSSTCDTFCRRPMGVVFVALFDMLLNLVALGYSVKALNILETENRRYGTSTSEIAFFRMFFTCLAAFHVWWHVGAFRLLKSSDPTLPGNERRRLTHTWKRVNLCFFSTVLVPVTVVVVFVILAATVLRAEVFTKKTILVVIALVLACTPFAVRVLFYRIVHRFTSRL